MKRKYKEPDYNPRTISKEDASDLRKWLEEFGDLSGKIYNVVTEQFPGGNQRSKQINIEECEIEYVKQWKKPDEQGTVAYGYVVWQGKRYNYREVKWDLEKEKRANVIANKAGGEWDWTKMKENFEVDDLLESGFKTTELNDWFSEEKKDERLDKEEPGQVVFSKELGKSSQYIVLKFEENIDFLQAKTLLGLDSRYSKRQNGKPWSRGIGRVFDGVQAVTLLREGENDYLAGGYRFKARRDKTDVYSIDEVFKKGAYKKLLIQNEDVVLDIGMNIGSFAVYAAGLGAKVVGIEPEEENFMIAGENVFKNKMGEDVVLLRGAVVGREIDRVGLYLNSGKGADAHRIIETQGRDVVEVRAWNINDLINEYRPNKLKIDCEGAEYEIMMAVRDWVGIELISMEWHRKLLGDESNEMLKEVVKRMEENGYEFDGKIDGKGWMSVIHFSKKG